MSDRITTEAAVEVPEYLAKLLNVMYMKALFTLRSNESVEPIMFFFELDESTPLGVSNRVALLPVGPLMNSQHGKELVMKIMRDTLKQQNVDLTVLVTEAWLAKLPIDTTPEEAHAIRVRDRPDKEEVVLFNVLTKDKQYIGSAAIIREPEVDLGPIEYFPTEESDGTMVREKEDAVTKR